MAGITNELMYEVLEHLQSDMAALQGGQRGANAALNAIRMHMVGLQQDIQNISALTRHQAPVPFKVMD
jgi:hypothetical protein